MKEYIDWKSMQGTSLEDLRRQISGTLITPDDHEFDSARKIFNGAIDRRPLLIIQCKDQEDVVNSVKFSRESTFPVSIRSGGHNVAGNAICDKGIVIDLSKMKSIIVQPEEYRVYAQAGVTWKEFDTETQKYGLATPGGTVSSTGIAGLTLGGGIGWLRGKYGLTCDNLIALDIVTADGKVMHACADENPDLFWGLRGGGGNFGIVTNFVFRLHRVEHIFGGTVMYPFWQAKDVLNIYYDLARRAPDELTLSASFLTVEATPVVTIDMAYLGEQAQAEALLAPLLNLGPALKNALRPISYNDLQCMFDNPFEAGLYSYWKSCFLSKFDNEVIDTILRYAEKVPSVKTKIFIDHIHGAAHRVPEIDTAFAHRQSEYCLLIAANWVDASEAHVNTQWTKEFFTTVSPFSSKRVYVNYLGMEEKDRLMEAYSSEQYTRLVALKNKYDPTNFFRFNQNIVPSLEENF